MDSWHLRKHDDGSIHGPVTLEQLRDWSLAAKISPLDKVSDDGESTWLRAPMIPDLHMDWLVEVSSDYLYGPTTFGTVQEFLAAEEIGEETFILNCLDGRRAQIKDMPAFRKRSGGDQSPGKGTNRLSESDAPGDSEQGKRMVQLENMLVQQRRALEESELRYQRLRVKYIEKAGESP
jgi:hypothetical protein